MENYLSNDAVGYSVGDYLYHVTPKKNLLNIIQNGFEPKDGVAINGKPFKNRLYFATSLIAAYDLCTNFQSYRDGYDEWSIIKVKSVCVKDGYENDPLFVHGIYVNYPIKPDFMVDVIDYDNLFGKFRDEDFEELYN
jgi:hypothetical protein